MAIMRSKYSPLLILAALLIYPLLVPEYYIYMGSVVMVYVIAALGLNLLMGYTGQISIANAAFFGIGAYASAVLCAKAGFPFWLSIPSAGLISAFVGFLLGMPALRLKGHYLALATIGFGEITQLTLIHWDALTEGPTGMAVPVPSLFGFEFDTAKSIYFIVVVVTVFLFWVYRNIIYSKIGRAFMTIRDSEVASESVGVNQALYKTISFTLSAFYAGIGGALYSLCVGWLDPENFGIWESIAHLTYVVVGGMGTLIGPVIGVAALTILPELLRTFQEYIALINAVFLLIFIIFLPDGMISILEQWVFRLFKFSAQSTERKPEG